MKKWKLTRLNIKKYFQFTRLKQCYKGFMIVLAVMIVSQIWYTRMSVKEIVITDFITAVLGVFVSLIVDWVTLIMEWAKANKNSSEE